MRPARLGDGLEVTVTRKYYRSGESEYYINKRQVRLKDIYELFYDTGIGREGYSVISQGKISEVLSQNGGRAPQHLRGGRRHQQDPL